MLKSVLAWILASTAVTIAHADCTDRDKTDCPPIRQLITFEAVAITAGPYGEMWELKYAANDELHLKVDYMISPQGDLSGKFLVSSENLEGLRTAVREQRFFELPKSIAPPALPFHAPDLRLRISLGDRTHLVQLYAPDSLSSNPEAARFLAVWKAVFALVPMQPTWKARG
jgi:hypothetical protein